MVFLGFHVGGFLSSGFLLGFFRFHLGSLNFRVSFRIQTGENKAIEENKNKEAIKTGRTKAKEQEVEQQKHITEEKKK